MAWRRADDRGGPVYGFIRGALILAVGAAGLIALAFGMMLILTSPDGWVTQAANTALADETTELTSFRGLMIE